MEQERPFCFACLSALRVDDALMVTVCSKCHRRTWLVRHGDRLVRVREVRRSAAVPEQERSA